MDEEFLHVKLQDLRIVTTLGVGGFGRVELVTIGNDAAKSYALKQMKKSQVLYIYIQIEFRNCSENPINI